MSYEIPEQPSHFVVDTEAERKTNWHNGSTVYCKDSDKMYILDTGAWKEIYTAATVYGLAGTKVYYVSDSSGGAVTRKLTFTNGILTAET